MEPHRNNYRVLLGDSAQHNVELFTRALASCPAFELCCRASTVSALISYLTEEGNLVRSEIFCGPDVVLLDLDFSGPGSGFEVLKWIRSQTTRLFRVVVLSNRGSEEECARAYALGADGFVSRPRSFDDIVNVLTRIEIWLKSSVLDHADDFCVA